MLIDYMAQGNSFWSFGAIVNVNMDTLSNWTRLYQDFSEAKKLGKVKELKWWDDLHRRNAATGEGNATLIVWAQKNKFPKLYKERQAKGDFKINHAITGDFKQLVANMDATQLHDLVSAIATQTAALEATHDTANNANENIRNNTLRAKSQKAPKDAD